MEVLRAARLPWTAKAKLTSGSAEVDDRIWISSLKTYMDRASNPQMRIWIACRSEACRLELQVQTSKAHMAGVVGGSS